MLWRRMLDSRKSLATVLLDDLDFIIYISQYAYNVLETIDKLKRREASNRMVSSSAGEILSDMKGNIKVANNLTLEA